MEQPIGTLQEISKERMGLIVWTGIYIRFKPERGLAETPFDVKGWEADIITRFFSYIIGGEADIASIKEPRLRKRLQYNLSDAPIAVHRTHAKFIREKLP
ncbi:MAG: hypothetical protein ACUVV4_06430 [Candidatus Bathyarchaeia archaeon]